MTQWTFVMEYTDTREILIEAENEEEAQKKMDSGDFEEETTIDFYANKLVRGLKRID